jgi:hypothetical protein
MYSKEAAKTTKITSRLLSFEVFIPWLELATTFFQVPVYWKNDGLIVCHGFLRASSRQRHKASSKRDVELLFGLEGDTAL